MHTHCERNGELMNILKHAAYTVVTIALTRWKEAHYLRIHASSSHKQNEGLDPINTGAVVKIRGEMVPLYKVAHHSSDWLPNCMIALHLLLNIPNLRQGSHNPQVSRRVWLGSDSLSNPREARQAETMEIFYIFANTPETCPLFCPRKMSLAEHP